MTVQSSNTISLGLILVIAGWLAILISIVVASASWLPLVGIALLITALKFA